MIVHNFQQTFKFIRDWLMHYEMYFYQTDQLQLKLDFYFILKMTWYFNVKAVA